MFQQEWKICFTKGSNENEYKDFQPENHVPKMESGALFTCGGLPLLKRFFIIHRARTLEKCLPLELTEN